MHLQDLFLKSKDITAQAAFYRRLLGEDAVSLEQDRVTVTVGRSRLTFTSSAQPLAGVYHVAFNIPENQFSAACAWLAARVAPNAPNAPNAPIANMNGETSFYSAGWDAHMVYFFDADGNIAELIARHTLANASSTPFDSDSLLNISEIGIAADDVPHCVEVLKQQTGARGYGASSDTFASVGDEEGLFIVVQQGRRWAPDTGLAAVHLPLEVTLANGVQLSFPSC
jgi:catechol-2,3-dioxygenase